MTELDLQPSEIAMAIVNRVGPPERGTAEWLAAQPRPHVRVVSDDPGALPPALEASINAEKAQAEAHKADPVGYMVGLCEETEKNPGALTLAITEETARRIARRVNDEFELRKVRGPRVKRTVEEYAKLPRPTAVLDQVLAAEVNLLAGPAGSGKSLLARDWALSVASGKDWRGFQVPKPRNVLYVATEGLHDIADRWTTQPLWEDAKERVFILDEPINLLVDSEQEWLFTEYEAEKPGLIVFDLIYGMGITDDNGVKDILPVINAMKRISARWGCATLAIGHNGHNQERRFRGSSMWRQLAATEWHMADGSLTCEKSKIAAASRLSAACRVGYPSIQWLSGATVVSDEASRMALVEADVRDYPDDTIAARARRLAPQMALSESATKTRIRAFVTED